MRRNKSAGCDYRRNLKDVNQTLRRTDIYEGRRACYLA